MKTKLEVMRNSEDSNLVALMEIGLPFIQDGISDNPLMLHQNTRCRYKSFELGANVDSFD